VKKRITLTLLALLVAVVAPSAYAETNVKVNVPFAFVAGSNTLPAGQYRISVVEAQHLVRIDGEGQTVMLLAQPADSGKIQEQTKLVFERVGDQTFLSKLWVSGRTDGAEIRKSRSEVNAERMSQKMNSPMGAAAGSQD